MRNDSRRKCAPRRCAPECEDSGFPCDDGDPCASAPCGPECDTAPCDPACGGDPCAPNCDEAPCNPACGGNPCAPDCADPPCQNLEQCDGGDDDPEHACVGEEKTIAAPLCPQACQQGCEPGEWQWDFGDPGDELIAEIITDPPTGEMITVRFNAPGEVTLIADNGCCAVEMEILSGDVVLSPDPDTHVENETELMVLPGDVEHAIFDPPQYEGDVIFTIHNSEIAKFRDGEELTDVLEFSTPPPSIEVVGVGIGETFIEVGFVHDQSFTCPLTVKVGGTITIKYDQLPTFHVPVGSPIGQAGEHHPFEDDDAVKIGGNEVLETTSGPRLPLTDEMLERIALSTGGTTYWCTMTVRLSDANDNPKPGRAIAILPQRGLLFVQTGAGRDLILPDTNDDGESSGFLIAQVGPNNPPGFARTESGYIESIAVLYGRAAAEYNGDPISDSMLESQSIYNGGHHTVTPDALVFDYTFESNDTIDDDFLSMTSLTLTVLNDAHYNVMRQAYELVVYVDPMMIENEILQLWDPATGNEIDTLILPGPHLFDAQSRPYLTGILNTEMTNYQAWLITQPEFEFMSVAVGFEPDDGEPPAPVTFAIVAAEFALAFIPGWDLVDAIRYGFWKPVINDEPTLENYGIAVVAVVGLIADAGYIAAVAPGFATNAVASAFKVIVKHVPVNKVVDLAIYLKGNLRDGIDLLCGYINKVPKKAGFDATSVADWKDWGIEVAQTIINQWNKILHSDLGLSVNHLGDSIDIIRRRGTRTFSDEAAEGTAFLAKRGRHQLLENLFDEFSEDVVEASLESIGLLAHRGFTGLSDEAMRGVAVSIDATSASSPLVREFVQGGALTASRAELAFSNLNKMKDVEGLSNMVAFLRNNRENAAGIDGAIFEGTGARLIADGEVAGSGALVRVSADGIPGMNRIDTLTSNWGIQIKHKTGPGNIGLGDLNNSVPGSQYLDEMVAQTPAGLTPCLITNRPITGPLDSARIARGIEWRQIPDE